MKLAVGGQPEQTLSPSQNGEELLPLRTRRDLETEWIGYSGRETAIVKDPVGLKYHRLQPVQYELLRLLESPQSLRSLQDGLHHFDPAYHFEIQDLQRMLADFHQKNLIHSERPGQGYQLYKLRHKKKRQDILNGVRSLLFLRLPGWSPTRVLDRLDGLGRVVLHPVSVGLMLMIIFSAMLLVIRESAEFQSRMPAFQQFFSWKNLPYMWGSIIIAKIVHEFGHAMMCRYYKAEPHQIGVMLLVFTPTMYCDVTDSWMLKSKWKRMAIGLAGALFEAVLAALAFYLWWWTEPGMIHFVCLNLFLLSAVTNIVFNLNPLVRFDGYYVLSDYLEIPNLKQQSDRALLSWFCNRVLGVQIPKDPLLPESGSPWLVVYALAAWCYRWVIMIGITIFLYVILKPYGLQQFSYGILLFTLGMMIYAMVRGMKKALEEIQPIKPAPQRWFALGAVAVGVVFVLALVPVPWWITCSFELQPKNVQHVHTMTEGHLAALLAEPGDQVRAGDVICRLSNPDLEDELQVATTQQDVLEQTLLAARVRRDDEALAEALDRYKSVKARIENLREQQSRLEVRAPVSGVLITAEPRPEKPADPAERLPSWHGTVFDEHNEDVWLTMGTPIANIAPSQEMEAVLLIEQRHRNDLAAGQSVTMLWSHLPGYYLSGEIDSIGERFTKTAPASLSQKAGGKMATVTDEQGQEVLLTSAYQAIVPISVKQTAGVMDSMGLRGEARVVITKRTLLGWGWRLFRQTFSFRL